MMTEREVLERLKVLRSQNAKTQEISKQEQEEINQRRTEWALFWRNNIHLYIKYKLGINTYDFQAISYYLMSQAVAYDELSSRGTSKTFRLAVWNLAMMLLYPNTEIVTTSSTFSQSCLLIEEKVEKELFIRGDISPVLHYMFQQGYFIKQVKDQKLVIVCTLNNSTLTAVGCVESARGSRCSILEFDERILLKEGLINSIFKPMRRPRQAAYLNRPEYQNENKDKYLEQPKTLSISSNRFTQEPAYQSYIKTFDDALKHPDGNSYICSFDIFTAIKHGIKTKQQLLEDKRTMDEVSFNTEVLNCPIMEADGAFFKLNLFRENQVLNKSFRPPTKNEYIHDSWSFRPKENNEVRVVFGDLAFTGDVKGKSAADLTSLGCLSIYKRKDRWQVDLEYLKTYAGGDPTTALKMRELVFWYNADYLIYDNRNGGDALMNVLSAEMHHPYIPDSVWNPHGLTVADKPTLQFCSPQVVQEIRNRTVDKNAIPIIIPMKASPEINHNMWMNFYSMLKSNQLNLLIDDLDFIQEAEADKEWWKLDSEEKAIIRMPYVETRLMIDEAINLNSSYNGTFLKLSEPRNKTKDRCVSVAYGLALAQRIITMKEQESSQAQEIDWSNVCLVF